MIEWNKVIGQVSSHVVKIETHNGWGTGFIVFADTENLVHGIATAHHVIEDAFDKPFNIVIDQQKFTFGQSESDRKNILVAHFEEFDAATLILLNRPLPIPIVPLLDSQETPLTVGMEIGWLGFPCVANELCFFSGRVSAIIDDEHFLVDGTAIHGVSGGPAFYITPNGPRIVGSITAYRPNPTEKGLLPGLSLVTHAAVHRSIGIKTAS